MFSRTLRTVQMMEGKNLGLFFSTVINASTQYTVKMVSQLCVGTSFKNIKANIAAVDGNGEYLYNKALFEHFDKKYMVECSFHQYFFDSMIKTQELFPDCQVTGDVFDISSFVNYEVVKVDVSQDATNTLSGVVGSGVPFSNLYF